MSICLFGDSYWLRTARWDTDDEVFVVTSYGGLATARSWSDDFNGNAARRAGFMLRLDDLMLSANVSDQSQGGSGDLQLTFLNRNSSLNTLSANVTGSGTSHSLVLSGSSTYDWPSSFYGYPSDVVGWKLVSRDTPRKVVASGRSGGGNVTLPATINSAELYDLYMWGQLNGGKTAYHQTGGGGWSNHATEPVKAVLKDWKIGYEIEYELNGGVNHASNPSMYSDADLPLTLLPATRSGFKFGGWYSDAALTARVTGIPAGSTGPQKFYAKWLVQPSVLDGAFEYKVSVTNASANVIVPANGRSTNTGTYNVSYAWYIEVSDNDGVTWSQLDCSAISQTAGSGSCGSGTQAESFTGTSANAAARGPVLGTMSMGTHWVRLIPVTASDGWLRAFATGRSGVNVHQSASMIVEVGDIPFKGVDGTSVATTAGDVAGYRMFYGASNLVKVGRVLASDDESWTAVTTVGGDFFREAFYGDAALTVVADKSFDTSGVTAVGNFFFDYALYGVASLESLPDEAFDISGISTVGTYFFRQAFYEAVSLESLPQGSFIPSTGLTTVGTHFFAATFFGTASLLSLPSGSFDMQYITGTVGNSFMESTFGGASASTAPKLERADVARVAASWKLTPTNLNKSNVFVDTFRNVATASGSLEEAEASQIALNPSAAKNTFTGTQLCTSSANYERWGLSNLCPFSYFDVKIRVSQADVDASRHVVVPAVGHTAGIAYRWRISVSDDDGVHWTQWDCTSKAIAYTGGGCDSTDTAAYVGTTVASNYGQGPDLGVFTTAGEYWIRLQPLAQSAGWLRAFYAGNAGVPMREQVIEVGDIPFLGLKDPATAGDPTKAGDSVGRYMFNYAPNLTRIGRFLAEDDPAWAAVTEIGDDFMLSMFEGSSLSDIADGSFDYGRLQRVGKLFMFFAFYNSPLQTLPAGSFDIGAMTHVGDHFLYYAFLTNAGVDALPTGSFDTSSLVSVGVAFLGWAFGNADFTGLPNGSFVFSSGLTSVPERFLEHTFDTSMVETLSSGSFDMRYITVVGTGSFMNRTFYTGDHSKGYGLRYEDILSVASSWKLSQSELDKPNVLRDTFRANGRDAGRLLQYQVEQLKLQPGGVATELRDTFKDTRLCTDSPFYVQYGLSECEPPHALPYTGSAAVWWWVLTVAVLLLSVPTVLARGRVLGGFAMGHALAGVDTASASASGASAGARHARRVRLSPHEIPPRRRGE
ncbi:InlB B-repeat-containing protein [Bifidobacterium crudilactis]|uniref:InlB B-repeat-containing protein n=1 Tax=Bifidobacterium crudilactis TaxID=327277 RepID=UPI002356718A|nr:InlB B-repeat-containing protein [Bifidobacterium crudilactis]MCI1217971.1 InlB B-repeat-containing protein [Bifidobacterium crudilactis]